MIRSLTLAVTIATTSGCAQGDTRSSAQYAPGFAAQAHTVSVLAAFKDGMLSSMPWESLGPHLKMALGPSPCDLGLDSLARVAPEAAEAVEDYAHEDGPTDDLLGRLSGAAKGDLVLVVTVAGRLPAKEKSRSAFDDAPASTMGARGPVAARASRTPDAIAPLDSSALDLIASFYSGASGRTVAEVSLEYTGDSLDDAMSKFAAKIAHTLPGARCVGWTWDKPPEPDAIRKAISAG